MFATNENKATTKTGIVDQNSTIWGGAPIKALLNGFRAVWKKYEHNRSIHQLFTDEKFQH